MHTSGAAVFIHSSIFCLIFMEKFKYENSPEYSAPVSRYQAATDQKTYGWYYPVTP